MARIARLDCPDNWPELLPLLTEVSREGGRENMYVYVCMCVCVSVTTLASTLFVSTCQVRYVQLSFKLFLIFNSWIFDKALYLKSTSKSTITDTMGQIILSIMERLRHKCIYCHYKYYRLEASLYRGDLYTEWPL